MTKIAKLEEGEIVEVKIGRDAKFLINFAFLSEINKVISQKDTFCCHGWASYRQRRAMDRFNNEWSGLVIRKKGLFGKRRIFINSTYRNAILSKNLEEVTIEEIAIRSNKNPIIKILLGIPVVKTNIRELPVFKVKEPKMAVLYAEEMLTRLLECANPEKLSDKINEIEENRPGELFNVLNFLFQHS